MSISDKIKSATNQEEFNAAKACALEAAKNAAKSTKRKHHRLLESKWRELWVDKKIS